ncbi:MAG: sialidase family protein [Candidatus Latescibacteria bacterium]|jgi:sialidase-1|nr:sialidase family protein [Candidatus Latescibacterota bacterium]
MQMITVSRDDNIYEAFADIAQVPDGTLVCTYRESMCHSPRPWSRVIVRRSVDRGLTWGPRQVVVERTREQSAAGEGRFNCSRITACADGSLLLIVDLLLKDTFEEYLEPGVCMNLLFRSRDSGATWERPEETGITEGIVPSIKELSNGDLIVGVTEQDKGANGVRDYSETQTVYVSSDRGRSWEGPFMVPSPESPAVNGQPWRLNEGDFAELDDGTLVVYMREDGERLSGWKSISRDGGRTWAVPLRTEMMHCLGRPSVGRLRSGEIAITYRVCCGLSTSLGLHVETPEQAMRGFSEGSSDSADPEMYGGDSQVRFAVLDNDRSLAADSGYSGWVQLEGGDLYVVNYITDDAPRAHIRGYQVGRMDWYLFPEGAIRRNRPSDPEGGYYERAQELARQQQEWADRQDWSRRVPTQK